MDETEVVTVALGIMGDLAGAILMMAPAIANLQGPFVVTLKTELQSRELALAVLAKLQQSTGWNVEMPNGPDNMTFKWFVFRR